MFGPSEYLIFIREKVTENFLGACIEIRLLIPLFKFKMQMEIRLSTVPYDLSTVSESILVHSTMCSTIISLRFGLLVYPRGVSEIMRGRELVCRDLKREEELTERLLFVKWIVLHPEHVGSVKARAELLSRSLTKDHLSLYHGFRNSRH